MPTTQNPTPPVYGPDPPDEVLDGVFGPERPDETMDTFVDDGTGLHPTATTYSTTNVAVSSRYGVPTATPTVDTYHYSGFPPSAVLALNARIGLQSNGYLKSEYRILDDQAWGNYSHWGDYGQLTYPDGAAPNQPMWRDGFVLRYWWNYKSPFTNQTYNVLAPTIVYFGTDNKTAYYFFDVIYNDFQAVHGYANWDYTKDGWPGAYWPGVIKTVRSVIGFSQVPQERDRYETYMSKKYGTALAVAPYCRPVSDMSTGGAFPTRYRVLPSKATVTVRDDLPPENAAFSLALGDEFDGMDMSDVSDEVTALQAAAVAKAVAAQKATDDAALQKAVSDALASAAITQAQAVSVQAALDAADKAQALAAQQQLAAGQLNAAVASAVAAGNLSQQQAVAAQAAADASAQSSALAAQAAADAATLTQRVASAVAAQAATDATQQAAAVAAQKAADASAQQAAVAAQAAADATAQATAIANAVAAQKSSDATTQAAAVAKAYLGLPQASMLSALPVFQNNVSVVVSSTAAWSDNVTTPYSMDYAHVWLKAFTGFDQSTSSGQTDNTTLAGNQVSPVGVIIFGGDSKYHGFSVVNVFTIGSGALAWYSGWLRQGTATQMCGWILYTASGINLVTTAYGFTSQSPRGGPNSNPSYTLTTSNTQSEILSLMSSKNMGTTNYSGARGFIYDASVGSYGQVTWISQI